MQHQRATFPEQCWQVTVTIPETKPAPTTSFQPGEAAGIDEALRDPDPTSRRQAAAWVRAHPSKAHLSPLLAGFRGSFLGRSIAAENACLASLVLSGLVIAGTIAPSSLSLLVSVPMGLYWFGMTILFVRRTNRREEDRTRRTTLRALKRLHDAAPEETETAALPDLKRLAYWGFTQPFSLRRRAWRLATHMSKASAGRQETLSEPEATRRNPTPRPQRTSIEPSLFVNHPALNDPIRPELSLRTASHTVRLEAAYHFCRIAGPDFDLSRLSPLIDRDPAVRTFSAIAIARARGESGVEAVRHLIFSENPHEVRLAQVPQFRLGIPAQVFFACLEPPSLLEGER